MGKKVDVVNREMNAQQPDDGGAGGESGDELNSVLRLITLDGPALASASDAAGRAA